MKHKNKMDIIVQSNIDHLEKLDRGSVKTWGHKLWEPEIRLLKSLQKEAYGND